MAFLFTVIGEWLVEGKVISRGMQIPNLQCRDLGKGNANNGHRYWRWNASLSGGHCLVCLQQDLSGVNSSH